MKKLLILMIVTAALFGVGCKKFVLNDDTKIRKGKFEKLLINKEWKYSYIKGDSTGLSTGQFSPPYSTSSFRYAINGSIKFLENGDFIHNGSYYGTYTIQYGTSRIDIFRGDGLDNLEQINAYVFDDIAEDRLELELINNSSVVYNN